MARKRPNAYAQLIQEGQKKSDETETQNTVTDGEIPQKTVKQQNTVKREKITFYLESDQSGKLLDMMEIFRKRTGVKINQQNMLRRILEVVDIDTVLP